VLLVGSNEDSTSSRYESYNLTQFHATGLAPPLLTKFTHAKLIHPAGVVLVDDVVYGLDQVHQTVLSWKATSGSFLGSLLTLAGPPEQIQFVDGC